ncbi:hypothetical protein ACH4SK_09915 [Streptomyces inhibens]|uniref:hypothetical protein n=1 Tax=Streptomyces inhibens TaxID=2293571 RepID=UPI00378EF460
MRGGAQQPRTRSRKTSAASAASRRPTSPARSGWPPHAVQNISDDQIKALEKRLELSGAKNETIDLWIDSDNLLVKKREQMDGKTAYDSTAFYSDYGTKVSVEEPPAGETVDFDKMGQ